LEENFDRINCKIHKEKEMADFRRWFTALAVPLVFSGIASAQVIGGGSTPLTCNVNTTNTPILRSEGITELVGDIVITCSGGQIFANGSPAPLVNITVSLTTQVTSRLLGTGASEALLLVDEPNSGLPVVIPNFGPGAGFIDCTTPNNGAGTGGCGPVTVLAQTGTDGKVYQTAVNSSGGAAPNTYQGIASGNQVTFLGVPVVPPGTNGNRVFRITNVRVNASGIGGGTVSGSLPVQASILVSNPSALPISIPTPIVGFVQSSLSASVSAGPTTFAQCVSTTLGQASIVTFAEKFASAFKTRVDPTVAGQTNSAGNALVQNKPGTIYNSESGFTLAVTSTTGSGNAGLADAGTRFTAVFNNLPAGARIFVSQFGLIQTAPGVWAQQSFTSIPTTLGPSLAEFVTSETTPDGAGTIPAGTPLSGPLSGAPGGTGPIAVVEITPTSGTTATATWEVVSDNPNAIDTFNFGVYVTYTASPGTNSPPAGTSTVALRYGPASTATTATSGPVPRFLDTSAATNAFLIGICRTILLYPFITNEAGFDTGIAIANTSTDPFGTTPQNGTCTMNWYGENAPGTPTTTPNIPTATDYATLASVVAPAFQGYMIAVCNFQYAHGFAFISDVGAQKLAMGYLPLVVPDPSLNLGRKANDPSKSAANSGEQLAQ
jgi:hypothetical protein